MPKKIDAALKERALRMFARSSGRTIHLTPRGSAARSEQLRSSTRAT
jgi:hypothetical protein